jgi:hypothetical protein
MEGLAYARSSKRFQTTEAGKLTVLALSSTTYQPSQMTLVNVNVNTDPACTVDFWLAPCQHVYEKACFEILVANQRVVYSPQMRDPFLDLSSRYFDKVWAAVNSVCIFLHI